MSVFRQRNAGQNYRMRIANKAVRRLQNIVKMELEEQDGRKWTGYMWLRRGIGGSKLGNQDS